MKKLIFLIIGALLLVGLVLPGCTGPVEPENVIKIAVVGPFTDLQGQNHWDGANMAVDEINADGGVTINSTAYTVELVKVETKEATEGESGTTGTANLENVIDDVAFCVGGFRTEVVQVYREVAMTAKKIFMNCGAATDSLQFSVVQDWDTYKYWFKATPYNSTFLVKSCLKMTAVVGAVLAGTLDAYGPLVDPDYDNPVNGKLRVAILMEDAAWCLPMVPAAEYYLPAIGFNTSATGAPDDWVWLVSPTDNDITDVLTTIDAEVKPHIIFTAFSGSVGAVYSKNKDTLGLPAMTIGINVPGQQLSHWVNTDGACVGEVMLDTWAVNMSNNTGTIDWFNDFVATTGRYPVYTAGTYDAIRNVCRAIEDIGSTDSDALVAWLEDPDNAMLDSIASPKVMYYPMPDITINATHYALSEDQVLDLYPDIGDPWIRTILTPPYAEVVMDGYHMSDWMCGASSMPHIAHDLVYGPGYVTGIGSQWQEISGSGVKVGVWPKNVGVTTPTFKLTDQYGNWNFQYDGTASLYIPIGGFLS